MSPSANNAVFLTLEGPDGCGKTTLAHHLSVHLRGDIFRTSEPTKAPYGAQARERILAVAALENGEGPLQEDLRQKSLAIRRAEALGLLLFDRLEHLAIIEDCLERGLHVLCDRYALSTVVYQVLPAGIRLQDALRLCLGSVRVPDLTVLVQTPVDVLLARIRTREEAGAADAIEREVLVRRHATVYADFAAGLISAHGLERTRRFGANLSAHIHAPGLYLPVSGEAEPQEVVAHVQEAIDAIVLRRMQDQKKRGPG